MAAMPFAGTGGPGLAFGATGLRGLVARGDDGDSLGLEGAGPDLDSTQIQKITF